MGEDWFLHSLNKMHLEIRAQLQTHHDLVRERRKITLITLPRARALLTLICCFLMAPARISSSTIPLLLLLCHYQSIFGCSRHHSYWKPAYLISPKEAARTKFQLWELRAVWIIDAIPNSTFMSNAETSSSNYLSHLPEGVGWRQVDANRALRAILFRFDEQRLAAATFCLLMKHRRPRTGPVLDHSRFLLFVIKFIYLTNLDRQSNYCTVYRTHIWLPAGRTLLEICLSFHSIPFHEWRQLIYIHCFIRLATC